MATPISVVHWALTVEWDSFFADYTVIIATSIATTTVIIITTVTNIVVAPHPQNPSINYPYRGTLCVRTRHPEPSLVEFTALVVI